MPAIALDPRQVWINSLATPAQHSVELSTIWNQLWTRAARHRASFFNEGECCVVLELASEGTKFGKPIDRVDLHTLEQVLSGRNQKTVASELGRSISSVSSTLRRILTAMGFECTGSKLPIFVVMAVHAARAHCGAGGPRARVTLVEVQGRTCQLVFVRRPDRNFSGVLSSAESAVARLLVEGLTHAHIARRRGTSRRTVANQLATSFRKLHVSGRIDMLTRLVARPVTVETIAHE